MIGPMDNKAVLERIAEDQRKARKLAADYNYDIQALLDAAWALPITFEGNERAHDFYHAVEMVKIIKMEMENEA
jgi:hypothetical protein